MGLEVLFETGNVNKSRCTNITNAALSLSPLICNVYFGLHAFTGCDSTSAFKGKGKVKAIQLVQKHCHFQELFTKLGEYWTVSQNTQKGMEEFTCALYGKARIKEVNDLRYSLLQTKCGGSNTNPSSASAYDLSVLPPCSTCLQEHVKRVNFQVGIWKRSHIAKPDIPDPVEGHGWTLDEKGMMVPRRTDADIMPVELVDILERTKRNDECDDEEDELFNAEGLSSDSDSDNDL